MARRDSLSRRTGWDPLLIISQIVALQACHYLVLALITPPLLLLFANPLSLSLEGGPSNVAMIMDWREMVGKATIEDKVGDYTRLPPSLGRHQLGNDGTAEAVAGRRGVDSIGDWQVRDVAPGSESVESTGRSDSNTEQGTLSDLDRAAVEDLLKHDTATYSERYYAADPIRGWVLGGAWVAASSADTLYIYHLIRRPTHILDFSVTLVLIHIVLTTYYASSFPTSLFFWAIIAGSAALQIIWAEQLCVRREMKEGFLLGQGWKTDERPEDGPNASNAPVRRLRRNSAPSVFHGNATSPTYERIPMVDLP